MKEKNHIKFFLGANTPQGFVSRFSQITDDQKENELYIIKGGPGTGKSSLMKNMVKQLENDVNDIELIYCSSDPSSLDGVYFEDIKTAVVDGTSPHVVEPKYPCVYENILSLYDFINTEKLKQKRGEITELFGKNKQMHERATRYLAAAGSIASDSQKIVLDYLHTEKISKCANGIAKREFPKKETGNAAEKIRFLSAVTPEGVVFFEDTIHMLCNKIYSIEDPYATASKFLLFALRKLLLERGYSIISCYCAMAPYDKLEHILVPELGLAFVTSNTFHSVTEGKIKRIHASRFLDMKLMREKKQRLSFNRKIIEELVSETISAVKQAKSIHDEMEKYYIEAVDFAAVEKKTRQVIRAIRKTVPEK